MISAGVPVIPGSTEPVFDEGKGAEEADRIGYPVIVKAALGGGGKGMRVAKTPEEFSKAFTTAQKEAKAAFGDDMMYIEHFVEHPRHIEFQILADHYGNVIHLGREGLLHSEKPSEDDRRVSVSCIERGASSEDGRSSCKGSESGQL